MLIKKALIVTLFWFCCHVNVIASDVNDVDSNNVPAIAPKTNFEIIHDDLWSLQPNCVSWNIGGQFASHSEYIANFYEMVFVNEKECLTSGKYLNTKIRITKSDCFSICNYIFGFFDVNLLNNNETLNTMDIFPGSNSWSKENENCGSSFGYESTSGRLYKSNNVYSNSYGNSWHTNNIEIELFIDFTNNRFTFFNNGLMQGWIHNEFNDIEYPNGIYIGFSVHERDEAIVELLYYNCIDQSETPTVNPTTQPTILPTNIPSQTPSFNPSQMPIKNPTQTPSMSPSDTPTISPLYSWDNPCNFKFMVTISTFKNCIMIKNRYQKEITQNFISAFEHFSSYHNKYHFNVEIFVKIPDEYLPTISPSETSTNDGNVKGPKRRLQSEVSFKVNVIANIQLICDQFYSYIREEKFIKFIQDEMSLSIDDKGMVVLDFNLIN